MKWNRTTCETRRCFYLRDDYVGESISIGRTSTTGFFSLDSSCPCVRVPKQESDNGTGGRGAINFEQTAGRDLGDLPLDPLELTRNCGRTT